MVAEHRIAVVAQDPLARSGLRSLLGTEHGFEVVTESSSVSNALDHWLENGADLLLWDLGAQAFTADFASGLERVPTLALAADEEASLALARAGVLGILPRSVDGEQLEAGLHAVAQGFCVFEPQLLHGLLRKRLTPTETNSLTPRESEVLELLAEGLSNRQIAARLGISDHTAKFHVNAILNKLGAETRTEAVVLAARSGWLML